MGSKKVNVGFLGAGKLNTIQHFPNIYGSDDAIFHTVCDLNSELIEQRAMQYNPVKTTTDYDEMLSDPDIDIIWIAAGADLQSGLAKRALEAGKHTFVEKPMAESLEECVMLGQLAKGKKCFLYTGYNRRFAPAYTDLKNIMDTMSQPPLVTYRLVDDARDRKGDAERNMQMIEESCHIFDLFAFLTGSEPVKIGCFRQGNNNDMILIRYANDALCNLTVSQRGTMSSPKERIEAVIDHAVVTIEDMVEMRTANVPGREDGLTRYKGNEYPGWLSGYKERMKEEGLDLVLHYRKQWQDAWNKGGAADMDPGPERDALIQKHLTPLKKACTLPPVNYMVDKGWRDADLDILNNLRMEKQSCAAGAVDAARSIACAESAIKSAQTGEMISMDPDDWMI